jgi:hypothetical protein
MKHWIACLSLVTLLLVTACDTVNHSQLQIRAPRGEEKTRVSVPASERETVKKVIQQIAKQWNFEDRSKISLVPDTICSYAQPDAKFPLGIRAWVVKERIIIDLTQKPPELAGESAGYHRIREQLTSELEKRFGDRLVLVHKTRQAQTRVVHSK